MLGLLGTKAPLVSDISLLLEISILIVLFVGRRYAKKGKYKTHGFIMTSAVTLHALTILLVMTPSFALFVDVLGSDPAILGLIGTIIVSIHVPAGLVAEILGVLFVAQWGFKPTIGCIKRRRLMLPLFLLWALSSILGIAIYAVYFL
jgi:uncharacterized membrane protein YozB (DUF420 family)